MLRTKTEEMKIYKTSSHLKIKGVPSVIVPRIGTILDEPIRDSDIDTCHRLSAFKEGKGNNNTIVRFVGRATRNRILAKSIQHKLTASAFDYFSESIRVQMDNERLNSLGKVLFRLVTAKN